MEKNALEILAQAEKLGADKAMEQAVQAYFPPFLPQEDQVLRGKIQKLADSLFQSLHIQLTTWRHGGQRWIRGAYLDSIDFPLNNAQWYLEHFRRILALDSEAEKLEAIQKLLHRTDPGEGGLYIQLGSPEGFQRYVVSQHTWEEDPAFLRSPHLYYDLYGILMNYYGSWGWYDAYPIPLEWVSSARVLYGTPLEVKVDGLDPSASYTLTVSYPQFAGRRAPESIQMTLYAGDTLLHKELRRHSSTFPTRCTPSSCPPRPIRTAPCLCAGRFKAPCPLCPSASCGFAKKPKHSSFPPVKTTFFSNTQRRQQPCSIQRSAFGP